MALPPALQNRLRLPVVGAPLFIISNPDLVIAQCKAGLQAGDARTIGVRPGPHPATRDTSGLILKPPTLFVAQARRMDRYGRTWQPSCAERGRGAATGIDCVCARAPRPHGAPTRVLMPARVLMP